MYKMYLYTITKIHSYSTVAALFVVFYGIHLAHNPLRHMFIATGYVEKRFRLKEVLMDHILFKRGSNGPYFVEKRFRLKEVFHCSQ